MHRLLLSHVGVPVAMIGKPNARDVPGIVFAVLVLVDHHDGGGIGRPQFDVVLPLFLVCHQEQKGVARDLS